MELEKMLERIDIREKYKLLSKIGPYYEKKQLYEIITFSCVKLYIIKFDINVSVDILFDFVYNYKRGINQRCKWLALKLNNYRFKKNNRQVSQAQAIIFLCRNIIILRVIKMFGLLHDAYFLLNENRYETQALL